MGKIMEWINGKSKLTKDGAEILDPRPMEMPVGFEKPDSIQEIIRKLITDPAIRNDLDQAGIETFDEADDFEIEDDEPISPHEDNFDPQHILARDQETKAGAVKAPTAAEIQKAVELLKQLEAKKQPPAAAKPKEGA
jgi:hypothetical protein